MNNLLITGSKGQLGLELSKLIPKAFLTDADTLDITDFNAVKSFVKVNNIQTIINCAAYTAVDKAEDEPEKAYQINVVGAENLAKTGCKLIHVSTDYVFDGENNKPYLPSDEPRPISVYGKTKLEGELAVLKNNSNAIIIRTAWLYSVNGNNFLKTMLRLGLEKKSVNVVSDQVGTPTYAGDLARVIVQILPKLNKENSGIYHYTNEGACSWFDFASEIMKYSNLDCKVNPIPSSEYPTRAKRPCYSILDKTKIKEVFGVEIPHWQEGLSRCLSELKNEEKKGVC